MTLPESSSLVKTKRAVGVKVMMSYSHSSLILFPTVLHKYLQCEFQYCSVRYFDVVFILWGFLI